MPTLSIIMPVFNHSCELKIMIESILDNSYQDWELLAIDDGSEQETLAILNDFAHKDSRIQVIQRTRLPKGAQTCRNIGLEMAKGVFIVFFDSDDYITPYCLKQRVEALTNHPELDFMVFPSGSFLKQQFSDDGPFLFGYPLYHDNLKAFLHRTLPFTVWTNIYRTTSLREKELVWDTHIKSFQDSDFNIQALIHGLKYSFTHALPDYGYRTDGNNDSISKKIASEEHRKSHLYFLDKQYQEIRRIYGKKYDQSLYRCALFIYTFMQQYGLDAPYARQIAAVVKKYDPLRGSILNFKINMSIILSTFLPRKIARQLPMPLFLCRKWWMEHEIARRISKIRLNNK